MKKPNMFEPEWYTCKICGAKYQGLLPEHMRTTCCRLDCINAWRAEKEFNALIDKIKDPRKRMRIRGEFIRRTRRK